MGITPSGQLSYGYRLGNDDDGWHIAELTEDGHWLPSWIEPGSGEDPGDELGDRILMAVGFDVTSHPGYDDEAAYGTWRKTYEAARRTLGVDIESHGYWDGMYLLLTTFHASAAWGQFKVLDMADLEARRVAEDWDGKLDRVTDYLGITVVDGDRKPVRPGWLLTSWYG